MPVRIVRLTFSVENIVSFKQVFEETRAGIMDFEGCQFMDLYQDKADPTTFFTYNHWNSEAAPERYRSSPFSLEVWAKTRSLLSEKAQAWSLDRVEGPN